MLSRRTWVHLLLAASAVGIAWRVWPMPAPAAAPVKTVTLVPGDALDQAIDQADGEQDGYAIVPPETAPPGGCLPRLDALVKRPEWAIHITDGASGCLGDTLKRTFTVFSTGRVEWKEQGLTRVFDLSPTELTTLRRLNRYDCIRKDPVGYGEAYYTIWLGGDGPDGAHIGASSSMGMTLTKLLDAAREQVAHDWHARVGEVHIALAGRSREKSDGAFSPRAAPYRVELEDNRLKIRRGARELYSDFVPDLDLMELVEHIEAGHQDISWPYADAYANGTLAIGGRTHEIHLGWASGEGPIGPLWIAYDRAIYKAEHPDSI